MIATRSVRTDYPGPSIHHKQQGATVEDIELLMGVRATWAERNQKTSVACTDRILSRGSCGRAGARVGRLKGRPSCYHLVRRRMVVGAQDLLLRKLTVGDSVTRGPSVRHWSYVL